jgi:hypothetical protein
LILAAANSNQIRCRGKALFFHPSALLVQR